MSEIVLEGDCKMTTVMHEYRKPIMTNMPADVGDVIFAQILNTPAPDDEGLEMRVKEFERKVREARRRGSDQGNTSR